MKWIPLAEQSAEDLHYMDLAIQKAQEAMDAREVPVGCVFVRNGEVIGEARNRGNELCNSTRHAELEALDDIFRRYEPDLAQAQASCYSDPKLKLSTILKDTTLYVTIEPCLMCASALRQVGIRKVIFGAQNDKFGGTGGVLNIHQDLHLGTNTFEALGGYRRTESIMLLRLFYLRENSNAPQPRDKSRRVLNKVVEPVQ